MSKGTLVSLMKKRGYWEKWYETQTKKELKALIRCEWLFNRVESLAEQASKGGTMISMNKINARVSTSRGAWKADRAAILAILGPGSAPIAKVAKELDDYKGADADGLVIAQVKAHLKAGKSTFYKLLWSSCDSDRNIVIAPAPAPAKK